MHFEKKGVLLMLMFYFIRSTSYVVGQKIAIPSKVAWLGRSFILQVFTENFTFHASVFCQISAVAYLCVTNMLVVVH